MTDFFIELGDAVVTDVESFQVGQSVHHVRQLSDLVVSEFEMLELFEFDDLMWQRLQHVGANSQLDKCVTPLVDGGSDLCDGVVLCVE